MTTSNGRTGDSRRSGRSAGQWLIGLLIVLAIAASCLMVFTDELSIRGSLAVIAALWAAVIAAILVTKFRRQAESAEAKSRDLRLVYELQLEREIAARRQYELDVEMSIRKEVGEESNVELAELKAQVLALRSSLEALLGEPLPDSRVALPSEKVRELASGLGPSSGYSGYGGGYRQEGAFDDDDVVAARDFAERVPAAAAPSSGPVDPNEQTAVIPVIAEDDPMSGRIAAEVPIQDVDPVPVVDVSSSAVSNPSAAAPVNPVPTTLEPMTPGPVSAEQVNAEQVNAESVNAEAVTAEAVVPETAAPEQVEPEHVEPVAAEASEPAAEAVSESRLGSWFGTGIGRSGRRSRSAHSAESGESSTPNVGGWSPKTADQAQAAGAAGQGPAPEAPASAPEDPAAAAASAADVPVYVDDTPTDEWERQAAKLPDLSATPDQPAWRHRGRHEVAAEVSDTAATGSAAVADSGTVPESTTATDTTTPAGSAPAADAPAADSTVASADSDGAVRRRRSSEEGGHVSGRPASELLNALRESGGSGRRRRNG